MPDVKAQRRRPQGPRSETTNTKQMNDLRKIIEVANVDEDVAREALASVDANDLEMAIIKAMEMQKEKDAWQEKKSKKDLKAEKEAEQHQMKIQAQKQAKEEAKKTVTTRGKSTNGGSRRPEQNGDVSHWNGHPEESHGPDESSVPRTYSYTRGRGTSRGSGRGGRGARGATTRGEYTRPERRSEARGKQRDSMPHNNSVSEWASSGIEPTEQPKEWTSPKTEFKQSEPTKSAPVPPKPMINGYASAAIRGQQKEDERKRQAEEAKRKVLLAKQHQEKTTEMPLILKEVDVNQSGSSNTVEKTPERPSATEKVKVSEQLMNTPPPGLSLVRTTQEDNTKTNAKGQEILDSLRSKPAQESTEEAQNRLISPTQSNRSTVSPAVGTERAQISRQTALAHPTQAVVFAGDAGQPSSSVDVQFGYVPEQQQRPVFSHPQNISNAISALAPEQQQAAQAQIYQQVHQAPPSTSAMEGQTHDLSQAFAAAKISTQANTWQTGPPPTAYAQPKTTQFNGTAYNAAQTQNYEKATASSSANAGPSTNGSATDPSGKSDALAFAQNMLNKNPDKPIPVQPAPVQLPPQQLPYQQYNNQYQFPPGQLQAMPMFHSPVGVDVANSHQNPLSINQLQQPPPGMAPHGHHFNAATSQDLNMWNPGQSSTWNQQYSTASHQTPLTSSSDALNKTDQIQQFNTNLLNLNSMMYNPYQQPPINPHLMMPVVSTSSIMGGLPQQQKPDYFAQQCDMRDYQQQQQGQANRNGAPKQNFDSYGGGNMQAGQANKANFTKQETAKLPQQSLTQQQMMAQYSKAYQNFGNVQTPPPGSAQQQFMMNFASLQPNYIMNPAMNMQAAMQPHMSRTDPQAPFPGYGTANAAIYPKPSGW